MPFFVKNIVFSTLIFFIINLFTPYVAFFLVDIPYYTIFYLQIWRLITTPFITTGLISIVFSLLFWYRYAVRLEREKGTTKYMLTFFMNSFFIQICFALLCLLYLFFTKFIYTKNEINYERCKKRSIIAYVNVRFNIDMFK